MSRMQLLHECDQAIRDIFDSCSRPIQKGMARAVTGIVVSKSTNLALASAAVPGTATDSSKYRGLQRLIANPHLDCHRGQRRLAARILASQRGRVDLLLDATTTGTTARHAGTVTLCFALAWHGRALPLVWRTWTADAPEQLWKVAWEEMSAVLSDLLPADTQVVVLADRGLGGADLARLALRRGWHYLLRVNGDGMIRLADGQTSTIRALVPSPGTQALLSGVLAFAPRAKLCRAQRHQDGRGTWTRSWSRGTRINVVAVWRKQDADPWILVTDLPADRARCREYRHRTWQEELFRDLKSFGWNWHASRVRTPERVERLLLLLAVATFWAICLAQRLLRSGSRTVLEPPSRRVYSHFQLGLRFIHRCLTNDHPVPCLLSLWRESTRPLKLS